MGGTTWEKENSFHVPQKMCQNGEKHILDKPFVLFVYVSYVLSFYNVKEYTKEI